MKKYKVLFLIIIVMIITLVICITISKLRHIKFSQINEYVYYHNHKEEIDKIELRTYTLLGEKCYQIEQKEGKEFLDNLKIKKKINYTVTDSNATLSIYFKQNIKKDFNFEAGNLIYENQRYELNKDIYKLIKNNEIECLN